MNKIPACISRSDLNKVINNLNSAVAFFDKEGRYLYCNEAYIKVLNFNSLGFTTSNIVGIDVHSLTEKGIIGKTAAAMCIEQKKKIDCIQQSTLYRVVFSTAIPYFDSKGDIQYVSVYVRDESEVYKLRAEVENYEEILSSYLSYLDKNRETYQPRIVVNSEMQAIYDKCAQISKTDISVLLLGESGVGKDVVASFIHHNSHRNKGPFITINSGAIPTNLVESELFGYTPGAFSGASNKGKMGAFEAADKGTIFLDEIAELPMATQATLLRVLETRRVTRVGSVKPIDVDFRLVTATNQNLLEKISKGEFREDLYYRIRGVQITIPPLRERSEDILAIGLSFLNTFNIKYKMTKVFSRAAEEELKKYSWPGNVRELKNVIEQLVVLSQENEITSQSVKIVLHGDSNTDRFDSNTAAVRINKTMPLKDAVAEVEKQLLMKVMSTESSSYKAAEILGIDQTTVLRKMKRYNLPGFREKD